MWTDADRSSWARRIRWRDLAPDPERHGQWLIQAEDSTIRDHLSNPIAALVRRRFLRCVLEHGLGETLCLLPSLPLETVPAPDSARAECVPAPREPPRCVLARERPRYSPVFHKVPE